MADISNPISSSSIKDRGDGLASQAKEKASDVMQSMKEAGTEAMQRAREGYDQVRDSASQYYEQGRQRFQDVGETMQSQIQTHPMNSVLIACGVGFLLGILFVRR